MSKTSQGKFKKPSTNSKLYKKVRKEYLQETISLLSLSANSEVLTNMPCEVQQELVFAFLQLCVVQHIKKDLELQVILLKEDEVQDDGKM